MITKAHRKILKEHLRIDWVAEVLHELRKQKIVSSKGTPYSESMIRMVFTGKTEHSEIERTIFKVYRRRELLHEQNEQEKASILKL